MHWGGGVGAADEAVSVQENEADWWEVVHFSGPSFPTRRRCRLPRVTGGPVCFLKPAAPGSLPLCCL
jgi:hypothetical protein